MPSVCACGFRTAAAALGSAGRGKGHLWPRAVGRPETSRSYVVNSTPFEREISKIPDPLPSSKWLSDLRVRIGKCIMFGCSPTQIADAGLVLRALSTEWRQLIAGCEGYLTGGRRGLENQKVAWGEMDAFGHVNNVMYNRYAESSRVSWVNNIAVHVDSSRAEQWAELMTPRSTGLIMKSIKTEFKFPMTYPDSISVYHKLRAPPSLNPASTSLFLDCMVLSHQHHRVAAKMFEDIAIYDYRLAATTNVPHFMQEVLEKLWDMQEVEKRKSRLRAWELYRAVERLEKGTWDRAGAVEDTGAAYR